MKKLSVLFWGICLSGLLVGCNGNRQPGVSVPTDTPIPTMVQMETMAPEETLTPTPTMAPEETLVPTPTEVPADKSVEAQLKIFAETIDTWSVNYLGYASELRRCTVTDLDHNGRLEIVASQMGGAGVYTYSYFYEITEDYDGIVLCSHEYQGFLTGTSQPDLMTQGITGSYYNKEKDCYTYVGLDDLKNGEPDQYLLKHAFSLNNGKITYELLAYRYILYYANTCDIMFFDSADRSISEKQFEEWEEKAYGHQEYENFGEIQWLEMEEALAMSTEKLEEKLVELFGKNGNAQ